ncbi:MAG: EamA family transporter, partial [Candidatus Dormibacteraceae bacterium]
VWNRHRVPPLAIVAIALGLVGVFVLVHPGGTEHVNPLGAAAVLLGAILWAAGSVQSKSANQPRNPFLASAMQMLGASVFLLLAGLATGELDQLHPAQIGWSGVLALAWLVVGGSLVAYSSYLIALRLLPLATVTTYAFVNPLISVVVGALFFSETLNLQVGIAALFTVAAIVVLLLARRPRRSPSPRRPSV